MSNRRRRNTPGEWHRVPTPVIVSGSGIGIRAYQRDVEDGHLSVFTGAEPPGWHLSISHRRGDLLAGRYPTWDEIVDARYRFAPPDVTMAMLLPPRDQWVNVHETTFHLWQVPKELEEG